VYGTELGFALSIMGKLISNNKKKTNTTTETNSQDKDLDPLAGSDDVVSKL
jgi:hypothetical protein